MKAGDRVTLRGKATRTGEVVLCSENEHSVMIRLDDGMPAASGIYINFMALLRTDGVYRDLIFGESIEVEISTPQG